MADGLTHDFTEKQLTSELVFGGKMLRVFADTVLLPDGTTATREYIRHPGAVIMLALLDDETVLLERQFRYPPGRHFYELPAGKIDPGEEPLATAKRELVEECGYEAKSWQRLATLHPCIGYSDERIELYLARDLVHVGHERDAGEFLEVVPLKVSAALEWIASGRITEVKAIIGLLWLERFVRGR